MGLRNQRRERLNRIYQQIKQRCYNPNSACYRNYGGRGIRVSDTWLGEDGFDNFYAWAISSGYAQGLTVERIDNNGNYDPRNCKWATRAEQSHNRRTNTLATINGVTRDLKQWSEETGIPYAVILRRRYNGATGIELIAPIVNDPSAVTGVNTRKIEVYMPPDHIDELKNQSKIYGISMSELVRYLVFEFLSA